MNLNDRPMSRHYLTFLTEPLKSWEQISSHFRISTLFSLAVRTLPRCFLWVVVTKVIIVMIIIRDKMVLVIMVEIIIMVEDKQDRHVNLTFQVTCSKHRKNCKSCHNKWCFEKSLFAYLKFKICIQKVPNVWMPIVATPPGAKPGIYGLHNSVSTY